MMHLADVDVDEVVVRVDVLSHQPPEPQEMRQQLPLLFHPRHPFMPVTLFILPCPRLSRIGGLIVKNIWQKTVD